MKISSFVFAAVAIICSGCDATGSAAPEFVHPDATVVTGTWVEADQVPGSSQQWTLSVSGTSVTGTGTWTAEACCGGTMTITGNISGDSLHLVVRSITTPPFHDPSPSDPIAVDAVLTTRTDLFTTPLGGTLSAHFVKQSGG